MNPNAAATKLAAMSASTGSLMSPYFAISPEKYPARPKNAACPSEMMPA